MNVGKVKQDFISPLYLNANLRIFTYVCVRLRKFETSPLKHYKSRFLEYKLGFKSLTIGGKDSNNGFYV